MLTSKLAVSQVVEVVVPEVKLLAVSQGEPPACGGHSREFSAETISGSDLRIS